MTCTRPTSTGSGKDDASNNSTRYPTSNEFHNSTVGQIEMCTPQDFKVYAAITLFTNGITNMTPTTEQIKKNLVLVVGTVFQLNTKQTLKNLNDIT